MITAHGRAPSPVNHPSNSAFCMAYSRVEDLLKKKVKPG